MCLDNPSSRFGFPNALERDPKYFFSYGNRKIGVAVLKVTRVSARSDLFGSSVGSSGMKRTAHFRYSLRGEYEADCCH